MKKGYVIAFLIAIAPILVNLSVKWFYGRTVDMWVFGVLEAAAMLGAIMIADTTD